MKNTHSVVIFVVLVALVAGYTACQRVPKCLDDTGWFVECSGQRP